MALVRTIIGAAYGEIGVLDYPAETPNATLAARGLYWIQSMIDAWGANRLTMSQQLRTTFTMPSGDSEIQIGSGAAVNIVRPISLNAINYIIVGSSPETEVTIGQMDEDAYAALSIKELQSAYPLQSFYQTNLSDTAATLFLWPQVTQDVDIVIYAPQAVGVPASLNTVLIGPPGYQDAFHYELSRRLCRPSGVATPEGLLEQVAASWTTMTRPNITPGVLGIDAALVPHSGAGYNILSDVTNASR